MKLSEKITRQNFRINIIIEYYQSSLDFCAKLINMVNLNMYRRGRVAGKHNRTFQGNSVKTFFKPGNGRTVL